MVISVFSLLNDEKSSFMQEGALVDTRCVVRFERTHPSASFWVPVDIFSYFFPIAADRSILPCMSYRQRSMHGPENEQVCHIIIYIPKPSICLSLKACVITKDVLAHV